MSNVIGAKAYQPKYEDCRSVWDEYGLTIRHYAEYTDEIFRQLHPSCKTIRRTSVVLLDGIYLLNPKGILSIGLSRDESIVYFNNGAVEQLNQKVDQKLSISDAKQRAVSLQWNMVNGDLTNHGHFYTTSPSRGETTVGQGAVDFLTATALFGEALRNLFFDDEKNRVSIIVLQRFVEYRRFYLSNLREMNNFALTDSKIEELDGLLNKLGDALYMSGAYYKTPARFEKRNMDTVLIDLLRSPSTCEETLNIEDIFNPDHLHKLVSAYI